MNTFKKSENKIERYPVSAICKKIEKHTIRFDHPAQRCSEQWNNKMKGNLISDILQGNPIPSIILAEQIINGVSIVWNLDGKQRCMNVYSYVHDGFKISKQVRRNVIRYQTHKVDENGKDLLDDQGLPVVEWKEFDITNKFFLPTSLSALAVTIPLTILTSAPSALKPLICWSIGRLPMLHPPGSATSASLYLPNNAPSI